MNLSLAFRLKTGGFLTEFATTWPVKDGSAPHHDLGMVHDVVTACENQSQSWSGWQLKVLFNADTRNFPLTC